MASWPYISHMSQCFDPYLVNFLGPRNEYVTVGSDDGSFFIWHKDSGKLHGIYEGLRVRLYCMLLPLTIL